MEESECGERGQTLIQGTAIQRILMPASVSFLLPDVNCPVVGPVIELARHLEPEFRTQIVGPDLGHGVCAMYRGSYPFTVVPAPRIYRYPDYWRECRKLAAAVTGDIVVAVKAIGDTIPVALRLQRERGAKVVAYLDEWDGALHEALSTGDKLKAWLRHAHHPLEDLYFPRVERLLPRCDLVLSTTTFLQRKFGGEVIHMGVNTDWFKPRPREQTEAFRVQQGLAGRKIIVFGGVVRPHKGLEAILDALVKLARPEACLAIVGPRNEHVEALLRVPAYAPYLLALGAQPKERMPDFLDMADLMVLPLQDSLIARSQMPCKVFEAMAMAKPVIGTAISDLPQVLAGCGRVVPPGDTGALADAIGHFLTHPEVASEAGRHAREKCVREYGAIVTRARLQDLIGKLAA